MGGIFSSQEKPTQEQLLNDLIKEKLPTELEEKISQYLKLQQNCDCEEEEEIQTGCENTCGIIHDLKGKLATYYSLYWNEMFKKGYPRSVYSKEVSNIQKEIIEFDKNILSSSFYVGFFEKNNVSFPTFLVSNFLRNRLEVYEKCSEEMREINISNLSFNRSFAIKLGFEKENPKMYDPLIELLTEVIEGYQEGVLHEIGLMIADYNNIYEDENDGYFPTEKLYDLITELYFEINPLNILDWLQAVDMSY